MKNIVYILLISVLSLLYSCESKSDSESNSSGKGGSLARFALVGDVLYTVDEYNLNVFSIEDPANPLFIKKISLGIGIETIFSHNSELFVGSNDGMYIYDIEVPLAPAQLSKYEHVVSCDPVVVDEQYAYVTLHGGSGRCWRSVNELQILDISDLRRPRLVNRYDMLEPKGLAIENKTLFLCDSGLKVFDVSDVNKIKLLKNFKIKAEDVIYNHGHLYVIGEKGLYQYLYSDTITLLSEMKIAE